MQRQGRRWHQRGVGGDVGTIAWFRPRPQFVRSQGSHKDGCYGVWIESQRSSRQIRIFSGWRRDFRGAFSLIVLKDENTL